MPGRSWDVAVMMAACILAPVFLPLMEGGSPIRVLAAAFVLLFAPGYLLLVGLRPRGVGWHRYATAVGLSMPLVGLAALATVLVPGGFRADAIMHTEAAVGLVLGAVALHRRFALDPADTVPGHGQSEDRFAAPVAGREQAFPAVMPEMALATLPTALPAMLPASEPAAEPANLPLASAPWSPVLPEPEWSIERPVRSPQSLEPTE